MVITDVVVDDVRFPTSESLIGSDAMNPAPDNSITYVTLRTDSPAGLEGHGLTFTIGRGNDLCVAAVELLKPALVGRDVSLMTKDMAGFWRGLTGDSHLRWLGPDKGVVHLATAAVVNAVWDLYAKAERKPLWKLLVGMTPEELVGCVDFRYISDAISPTEALEILRRNKPTQATREREMTANGYPAYTMSPGWLGYTDQKVRLLCRQAVADGWTSIKMKVGVDIENDLARAKIIREEIGWERNLMMDANQVWDVSEAISNMRQLAEYRPYWIEEPTSPDDVLGHRAIAEAIKPIKVASGEQCQNRVIFKQLLQAHAIGVCQIDCCRLGGVNEVIAVLLMAAKFGVPVCPHAGGIGLGEYAQHIAILDYVCISGSLEGRMLEYVDHGHDHFAEPVTIKNRHYMPPVGSGYGTVREQSLEDFRFPSGLAWRKVAV